MMRRQDALLLAAGAIGFLSAALAASPAHAGDLYLSGRIGVSTATGETGGSTDFGFSPSGSDGDSAPIWGGALGLDFGFDEPVPSAGEWALSNWRLRLEIEGLGGRDYELRTEGADPFFTETTTWTVMQNLWVDAPLHGPISALFGRVPILEPLSLYTGAGVGLGIHDVSTTDNVSAGSDDPLGLVWQAGAGLGYSLTDLVTLSIGYRYQDLGSIDMVLYDAPQSVSGRFELDLTAHEVTTGLRVSFYPVPLPSFQR